jgi:cytochrome c biogenesis protein CcmG/thiol:disulfide interchange protein DsbE
MTNRTRLAVTVSILLVAALGYAFLANTGAEPPTSQKQDQKQKDQPRKVEAPDFTLKNLEGEEVQLSTYKGKIVFVNFWATWCGPCRHEVPAFIELQEKYGEDLVILGISLDQGDLSVVPDFAEEYAINYEVLYGSPQVVSSYGGIGAIPTTFIVDKEGFVRDMQRGFPGKEYFEKVVAALM